MKIVSAILDQMEKSAPYATSKPLRLADVELSGPGPEEILVKIEAAGLCHSDLSVINGDRPRPTPMALGHEACATVMASPDFFPWTPCRGTVIETCERGSTRDEVVALARCEAINVNDVAN